MTVEVALITVEVPLISGVALLVHVHVALFLKIELSNIYIICIIATIGRREKPEEKKKKRRETFDCRDTFLVSPGSFALYLNSVASLLNYWHARMLRYSS